MKNLACDEQSTYSLPLSCLVAAALTLTCEGQRVQKQPCERKWRMKESAGSTAATNA